MVCPEMRVSFAYPNAARRNRGRKKTDIFILFNTMQIFINVICHPLIKDFLTG
jgi:hypothetical protein